MSAGLRRVAGEAWAFREQVERDASRRFARLALEIGGCDPGSPVPALLERAAGDERRHAALCAGLRAAYGAPPGDDPLERRLAPSRLPQREAALYEIVAACCITETESVATVATLLAAEAEPEVRAALHEIARDEVVHSRIGWRHLAREASAIDVSFLAEWIPAMLSGTIEPGLFSPPEAPEPEGLTRAGLLPRARKREVFVRTLEVVVLPGLEVFGVGTGPARDWLAQQQR